MKAASISKISQKRAGYVARRKKPSNQAAAQKPAGPRMPEQKWREKKARDMERARRMVSHLGNRLRMNPNLEAAQNVQLRFLREAARKGTEELVDDGRVLGMLQCYHFFRHLCMAIDKKR
ncbi:MAG: hypothetical protein P4M11_02590 [Candidatus Pacebacteria bacterium]|nr:hypothetical protein [Candidatus Paceibacterota bacterium]